MKTGKSIRPVTWALGLYFILMGTDIVRVGNLGSFLRLLALIPVGLTLLDFRSMKLRFSALSVFSILLAVYAVSSLWWSIDTDETIRYATGLVRNTLLVLVLGMMETYSERETEFLSRSLLVGSWVTVLLMLLFSDYSEGGRLTMNLAGGIQDQNAINGYTMLAFSWHVHRYFKGHGLFHLALSAVLLLIAFYTGSRGAVLSYGVVFLALCITTVQDQKAAWLALARILLLLTLMIAVALMIARFLPDDVAVRFSPAYILKKGATGRMSIWKYLWNRFLEAPLGRQVFGHGYGTTITVNQLNHLVAHNLYLDNLISMGIVGLLLQISVQISCLWSLRSANQLALHGVYCGFLAMCLSLSMTSYKPMWNVVTMALIFAFSSRPDRAAEKDGVQQ